jgi:hypothetical protein
MPRTMRKTAALALFALPLLTAVPSRADEGMYPFNMVPREAIQKAHGVSLDDKWLDHVRLASVRFNSGGSGSFVGPTGLVLTNHHVAGDCIQKIGGAGRDWMATGYLAGKDGPEVKCPDLELNVLVAIEDVTDKVRAARNPGMSDADANIAMKGEMSRLEKACNESTKNRCDVVTLYAGGRYDLYTYKKYTDVRLVFAPEFAIAFFGGDADNFTYPRFDLDMAIFRIYEGDKPLAPSAYLAWNTVGPKDGETVFVSGNPASTGRMQTYAQLEVTRDVVYPYLIDEYKRARDAVVAYGKESHEAERQGRSNVFRYENGIKALSGMLRGLKDPALMKKKAEDEAQLKKGILADPKLAADYGDTLDKIAGVQKEYGKAFKRYAALEGRFGAPLLSIARDLVRLSTERGLPNEKRLREYRESNLESLKLRLLSPAPIYGGVELALTREWLERLLRDLGPNDPLVKSVLAGRTPDRAARELLAGSQLTDVNARKKLLDGGKPAIDASTDPLIVLARAIDPDARAVRKQYDDGVEAPMRQLGEKVARATFGVRGPSQPPDATFTLRLSIGTVKGYTENGKAIPFATDFTGMYAHATGKEPLKLPQRWVDAKAKLKPATLINFVSTDDIIGGNSGSPVVNAAGEIVGLVFDGNLSSLPNRFVYGETTQRCVSVHTAGMSEALRTVYGADALAKELEAR